MFIRLDRVPACDGRTDRRNCCRYYSAMHCMQCGRAVKIFFTTQHVNPVTEKEIQIQLFLYGRCYFVLLVFISFDFYYCNRSYAVLWLQFQPQRSACYIVFERRIYGCYWFVDHVMLVVIVLAGLCWATSSSGPVFVMHEWRERLPNCPDPGIKGNHRSVLFPCDRVVTSATVICCTSSVAALLTTSIPVAVKAADCATGGDCRRRKQPWTGSVHDNYRHYSRSAECTFGSS